MSVHRSSFTVPALTTDTERGDAVRKDIRNALRAELSADPQKSHLYESAVDTNSTSSLQLPRESHIVRRRSELPSLSHSQPGLSKSTVPDGAVEEIELPALPRIHEHAVVSGVVFHQDSFVKSRDPEVAPSFPNSLAPSLRFDDETGSIQPIVPETQSKQQLWKGRIHFAALCFSFFLEGWNDGSTGPLLPTIQRFYNVGYSIVSLLFVFNCVGFVSGAVLNVWLNDKFGFGKVLLLGSIFQLAAYAILAPAGPFPVMCFAFVLSGFGIALQNAQANGFVGALKHHVSTKLGFLHATYGLGAFAAPLVATQFSTARHWSFHYIISAGIGLANVVVLYVVFRGRRQDVVMAEEGQEPEETSPVTDSKYKQIMNMREVHLLAIFSLIYVGVEVTLGGWIVTFIQDKRSGGSNAGYISSGFFGGLMLGRISLMWLNRMVGERRIIFMYVVVVIILEVTIWVVPSLIENAVAVSFIGLLLGPIYPIMMKHSTRILPMRLLTGCIGYIAGVGQAGSAVLPFATGLLSARFGISSLQPFIVSMMSTMMVLWALVPRTSKVD